MEFNGKRGREQEGGLKYDSDEAEVIVSVGQQPATESAVQPTLPATLVVRWNVLLGGMLFFMSALLIIFVVLPAIRDVVAELHKERESIAGRVKVLRETSQDQLEFQKVLASAQQWLVNAKAQQIAQHKDASDKLHELSRELERLIARVNSVTGGP